MSICCKDCKYFDGEVTTPFPGGKCHGYFGGEKGKLVKETDFCSRGEEGSYKEYCELIKLGWAYTIAEIMKGR